MKYLANHYYHIYNRGVNHQPIFQTRRHYIFFLQKTKRYCQQHHISLLAWCLMPNHYHFLIRNEEDGNPTRFLQTLCNSYVQAYNKETGRKGQLFERGAKAKVVDSDEYVMLVARYIHLNPVKTRLVTAPEEWEFSNFQEWIGIRNGTMFNKNFTQEYFSPEEYREFVQQDIKKTQKARLERYIKFFTFQIVHFSLEKVCLANYLTPTLQILQSVRIAIQPFQGSVLY
jgi:REP element-mobilizing transposase RayT